jgi:hypothetical protein
MSSPVALPVVLFARRLGPRRACPHCSEPVTLDDLLDSP